MLTKSCCQSILALMVVLAVFSKSGAAVKPLSAAAAEKISNWVTTDSQGKIKAYLGMGITAEVTKSRKLLGFKTNVGLHSFVFTSPKLQFTAEYRTDEDDQASRNVYPARVARATVSAMKITGTITLGGNDKTDLDYEFDASDRHLISIVNDGGTEIDKPVDNSSPEDKRKYNRLIQDTIVELGHDVRNKLKVVVFKAKPNELTK